jgi:hypothetical protein
MEKSFLEKIGILFATSVYIEWIIKDLIILKKYPEYIDEINSGVISKWLIEKREVAFKSSFTQEVVDEFIELYDLNPSYHKLFTVILLLRDIFWHSRIWIEDQTIWYCPKKTNKLKKIKDIFWIEWDWNTITIREKELNFDERVKMIEYLDKEVLPEFANKIGLNYAKLR